MITFLKRFSQKAYRFLEIWILIDFFFRVACACSAKNENVPHVIDLEYFHLITRVKNICWSIYVIGYEIITMDFLTLSWSIIQI